MSDDRRMIETTPTKVEQVAPIVESATVETNPESGVQKDNPIVLTDTTKIPIKKQLDPHLTVETKEMPKNWKPLQVKKTTIMDSVWQAWESRFVCLVLTMITLLFIGGVSFAQVIANLSLHGMFVSCLSFVGTVFTVRALYLCRETSLRSIG